MERISVDLADIFEYIDSSRPIKEGEAVYNAGHVTQCGIKDNSKEGEIIGFCLQTSNINGPPHKIQLILNDNISNWKAECSCKAGLGGKCKHITAVLIHLNRIGEVEKLSCTDVEQMWGKVGPKQSSSRDLFNYSSAMKIQEFCHPITKRQKIIPDTDANMHDIEKCSFNLLKSCDSSSSIAKFFETRHTCQEDVPDIQDRFDQSKYHSYDTIKTILDKKNCMLEEISNSIPENQKSQFYLDNVSNENWESIYNKTLGQNSSFWHAARKYRITGSNCYSFFTYSKNSNADWDTKLFSFFNSRFTGNSATRYGQEQEKYAREKYISISNQIVKECGLIVNKTVPWLAFSPDGLTDENFLLEIKCPILGQSKTITDVLDTLPYLTKHNDEYFLKQHHTYYGQIQLGLSLLNLDYCDFVIFASMDKSIHVIKIKHNVQFCKIMLNSLKDVYFQRILPYIDYKM